MNELNNWASCCDKCHEVTCECPDDIDIKYQRLLEFVWKTYDLNLCREENKCDCVRCEARDLLKEIGELNDR